MTVKTFEEDLVEKFGADNFKKIRNANIGIAGAGGLGSNCAGVLVRSGFIKFTIVDFDKVEAPNLDRQFYFLDQVGMPKVEALKVNLLRINPDLELRIIHERIERDNIGKFFDSCEAVAECLDSAKYKSVLTEELLSRGIFTAAVSGLGGIGGSDDIKTRRVSDILVMVGDEVSDISAKPAFAPRVNVAAAKQADAILEFIIGRTASVI